MKKTIVEHHFDEIAKRYDSFTKKRKLHYSSLKNLLRSLIPHKKKVFELGCGTGDIIVSLIPKNGYGVDISSEMIKIANKKHSEFKNIKFSTTWPKEKFDYIFMSDVIEHLEHPNETFRKILKNMNYRTIFINTMMNPIWEPIEILYSFLGMKMPEGPHHRMKSREVIKMMEDVGLRIIKHDYELLVPINIPFITNFANKYLERYLKPLCFIEYFVAVKR